MDHHNSEHSVEGIAVIGMSGCFPGAEDLTQFWRNLCAGVESISFFSEEEHELPFWADADAQYVRAKGVLERAEWFDAAFFGYTPEEAMAMDPQHRLFLERGWETIESAGYDAESYPGSIGVFAGVSTNTYLLASMFSAANTGRAWFTDKDFVTTRLSYKLNLRGPSLAVQTACSTSLVAVCQACQSLLNYQCDMAVAGGASVWAPKKSGYPYIPGGPVSPDGHCRAFADNANGFVPGSGVGAVLLKRLSEAIDDGDSILAVIKGFAVNNDGGAKIGYTAPSIDGQAEVIAMAQALAGVSPESISYIEAHGTGTDLGDPIEVAALTQVFRASSQKKGFCAVGSVKPNIGHLDAAAGIAGLIKAVLALKHRQIPPSINYERPNPKIDFTSSPFYVNSKLADWHANAQPRRAGVSAYGIGGTNAHVVLEEAPPSLAAQPSPAPQLLLLSARSAAALDQASQNLAEHLETHAELDLADVAYTLKVGRKRFSHRRIVVCPDIAAASAALRAAPQRSENRVEEASHRRVAMMFPGQGSQYPGMAREVYEQEPAFRDMVDRCCQALQPELDLDLRQAIFADSNDAKAAERLMQTSLAQPAIFVIEYALAQLWISWGIQPAACIGHSIGEYVAACLAGVFELNDALRLVAARARLMNRMPRGAMLAVPRSAEDLLPWLSQGVALAAVNAPALCVLSGPSAQIDSVEGQLKAEGVGAIRLHASHAFHSAMMDPILAEFEGLVAAVPRHAPQITYLSNLTGTWIESSQSADPAYWSRHLRQPVRFSPGLQVLLEDQELALLEVGPGRTLTSLAQAQSACGPDRVVATSLRHPQDTRGDRECLLQAAGQLWLGGAALDWPKLHEPLRRRVALPTYPFQRQRYWACDKPADPELLRAVSHAGKNGPDDRFYIPSWKRTPTPDHAPQVAQQRWLVFADHAGLSTRLIELLAVRGGESIVVEAGEAFAEVSPGRYRIDPHSKSDYLQLVQKLARQDLIPDRVVHAWCVTGPNCTFDRLGFYSLLYLAQALAEANFTALMRFSVLTDGAQAVTGDEAICAEKALVQGPCRVLPQEFPQLTFQHVDVCLKGTTTDDLAQLLLLEIAGDANDQAVAYRHGYRWTQTYEQTSLPASADDATLPIRKSGVYLITGGLGGIGLVLADWLARTVQAKLVLTSRSARRGSAVEALEASGAEVLVLPADVCDEQQMRTVIQQARQRFGPLQGVLHAAGIAGGGVVQLKTHEMAERVLAPKVDGLRVLQRVLREEPLEFVALCSSTAALAGGFGQIDYCAANAFLDAAAWESRAAGGPPTLAINWNAWREVGMAVETQLPTGLQDLRRQVGLEDSLSNGEGADAFRRILAARREPQVAVSISNLPEVLRRQREQKPQDLSLLQGDPGVRHARPELATPFEEPATDTERATAEIWQTLFGFDCVGRRDDFFELGGHSLLALQLLEKLRLRFGVNLTLPNLFEQRTVADLSQRIDSLLWASQESGAGADSEREEITL